jgi:hypothetical protein
MIKIFAPILIAIALIVAAFFLGKDYGKSKEGAVCQEKEIITQNEEIKTVVKSAQNRKVNNLVSYADDLFWLQQNNCADCKK